MGVLKNLTDEYFGKKIRTEDRIISTYLKKCIDSNKRDLFIKVNKGWGEDGKTILLYEKDVTLIGEAKIMTIEEVIDFFKNEFRTNYRCIHIDNFKATPETYRKMITYDIFPESIRKPIDEILELYCKYPEVVSFFTHIHFNKDENLQDNIFPGEITDYDGDEFFSTFEEYEEGDDVIEFVTTDGNFFPHFDDEEYSSEWSEILEKICKAFDDEGFKGVTDMIGTEGAQKMIFFGKIK